MRVHHGRVNDFNEAVVEIEFEPDGETIEFMLDTGFNGNLCVPRSVLQRLNLTIVDATYFYGIGGKRQPIDVAYAKINWFGSLFEVFVLVNDGDDFLLGTQLLADKELYINYKTGEVVITENE